MFEIMRLVSDLWVAAVMAGLIWFWAVDFDRSRRLEWLLSVIAIPPVALTLWRAIADLHVLGSAWLWGAMGGV